MGSIDFGERSKSFCGSEEGADQGIDNEAFDSEEIEREDEVRDDLRNDGNNNKGAGENGRGQSARPSLATHSVVSLPSQRRRSSVDRIRQTKPYRQLSRVLSTTFYHHSMNYALEGMTETVINFFFFTNH